MMLNEPQERERRAALPTPFRRAYSRAYGLGAAFCVALPLIVQVLLRRLVRQGSFGLEALAQELGYTFTGLTALALLVAIRLSGRTKAEIAGLGEPEQPRKIFRRVLLLSALLGSGTLFGLVTFGLGGPGSERYARTFLALPVVLFLAVVPRPSAYRKD